MGIVKIVNISKNNNIKLKVGCMVSNGMGSLEFTNGEVKPISLVN